MGVPEPQGHNKERVAASNSAAEFVLGELRLHQSRGGTSGRENPANSLRWYTLTEVGMSKQGAWWDKHYDACTLQGARRKKQCIRHDVEEIRLWPDMRCRHMHRPQEWTPQVISTSQLAEEIEELIGKRLLSDTPENMPCTADVLIAMIYYAWRNGSLKVPQEDAKPRRKAQLPPNRWSRRAHGLMAARTGDALEDESSIKNY